MEVQGTIKLIGEVQTFGSNGFAKRDLVVVTDDQYPQSILIEFVQDNTDLLDQHAEGEAVVVSINLRGREWTNPQGEVKYFNSLQGWRIQRDDSDGEQTPKEQETPTHETDENPLPF